MKDKDKIIIDYLNDILDSIIKIKTFLKDMDYPDFKEDVKTQYAVIRALEIIGEASKKIPQEVKDNYSWIPWRAMSGMRDKLIHDYFGVDAQVVWNTATEDILKLEEEIKNMVSSYLE
ncbi:HepT-like ribonuclease domain-containing protein [Calditrichota bacterium GD2]